MLLLDKYSFLRMSYCQSTYFSFTQIVCTRNNILIYYIQVRSSEYELGRNSLFPCVTSPLMPCAMSYCNLLQATHSDNVGSTRVVYAVYKVKIIAPICLMLFISLVMRCSKGRRRHWVMLVLCVCVCHASSNVRKLTLREFTLVTALRGWWASCSLPTDANNF